MKTIQQVLSEQDIDEVINYYFSCYPENIFTISDPETKAVTIERFQRKAFLGVRFVIKRLLSMHVKPSIYGTEILFAHKFRDDLSDSDIKVSLIRANELMAATDLSDVKTYSYMYEWQKDAIGYYVADTKLTQDHILDVVASFLDEVMYFGLTQEHLEEARRDFDEARKELKEHPHKYMSGSMDELSEELGLPADEIYPEEEAMKKILLQAEQEYNNYCKFIELRRIRESLK